MQSTVVILALVGAPIMAVVGFCRVFKRYKSSTFERLLFAGLVGMAFFNSWMDLCDKILKAVS